MDENVRIIVINSILGGQSPSPYFSRQDQFIGSLGIDPGLPHIDASTGFAAAGPSGLLRPSGATQMTNTDLDDAPMWIVGAPKTGVAYLYDAGGSTFTLNMGGVPSLTAISDAGEMTSGAGNGAAYYDNYIYFAKATTVARYGPLDGTKTLDGNWWTTTLGKTALTDPVYPLTIGAGAVRLPNHVMHRHSDGKLYFADVVGNQGTLHYIKTTKTTVEGDTDSGSTYGALTIGRGLYPTALESYGSDLVIALIEAHASGTLNSLMNPAGRAKIAFWDTTSTNFNKIIWVEFPDPVITAMRNIDGVLYVVSGNPNIPGFRLSRFIGGYTFEEVFYSPLASPSLAGAVDGDSKRLLFGSYVTSPAAAASVLSWGLQAAALGQGLFNIMRATTTVSFSGVTALIINKSQTFIAEQPFIGWSNGSFGSSTNNGIDKPTPNVGTTYGGSTSVWWSSLFKIGKPFRIKRVRLPFAQAMATNMTLTVKIYTDDASSNYTGDTYGLPTLNNTVLPNGERAANLKVQGVEGIQNFFLALEWSGTALITVAFPIEIEVEIIDEQ